MNAIEQQKVRRSMDDHWRAICKLRQELNKLYEQGESFTSEKMIRAGMEIDRHGKLLIELDHRYEDMLLAELLE